MKQGLEREIGEIILLVDIDQLENSFSINYQILLMIHKKVVHKSK